MEKILVIEDDASIHDILNKILSNENYEVLDAYSGEEGLRIIEETKVDLIILDLMLPKMSGEDFIKRVEKIPIIVLSAKTQEVAKVECLRTGACDYMTKPFGKDELLARIEVHLRKNKKASKLRYKDLELDIERRLLNVGNKSVTLTRMEEKIMEVLLSNPKVITTKSNLLEVLCEYNEECDEISLKVHIFNIRKKIRSMTDVNYIESVYGIGFKLYD